MNDLDKQWLENLVVSSHQSQQETTARLAYDLKTELQKQGSKVDEMYNYLTTSRTLWGAIVIIGNWVVKIAAVALAIAAIQAFYYKLIAR